MAASICLLGAGGAVAVILERAASTTDAAAAQLQDAARPAWAASHALSTELVKLRRGAPRAAAQHTVHKAATATGKALVAVRRVRLPTSKTPWLNVEVSALRAQGAWVDAVGSTLANPRSARRADLARLAKNAAREVQLVRRHSSLPDGAVGGTGHLLAATTP